MGRGKLDPLKKSRAIELLKIGRSVNEVVAETDISLSTVSSWRTALRAGKDPGRADKRRARKQAVKPGKTIPPDTEGSSHLLGLENQYLRLLLREPDRAKRKDIEILYLRERLALNGDTDVKPLFDEEESPGPSVRLVRST